MQLNSASLNCKPIVNYIVERSARAEQVAPFFQHPPRALQSNLEVSIAKKNYF